MAMQEAPALAKEGVPGNGPANSFGRIADEDVLAPKHGAATVDGLISIVLQGTRVVKSWMEGQSQSSLTAAMSRCLDKPTDSEHTLEVASWQLVHE